MTTPYAKQGVPEAARGGKIMCMGAHFSDFQVTHTKKRSQRPTRSFHRAHLWRLVAVEGNTS